MFACTKACTSKTHSLLTGPLLKHAAALSGSVLTSSLFRADLALAAVASSAVAVAGKREQAQSYIRLAAAMQAWDPLHVSRAAISKSPLVCALRR